MMMHKRIVLLVLSLVTLFVKQTGANTFEFEQSNDGGGLLLEEHHRQLSGTDDSCIDGTKIYYFEVTITLQPQNDTAICRLADQVLLGQDINILLFDYGIGAAGADDDAIFLAGVCTRPSSAGRRKLQIRRGYVWSGGGGCRGCFSDAWDGRRRDLQLAQVTGPSEETWFRDTYAPWLETTLEAAITNSVAPGHTRCLGQAPEYVGVAINEIELSDLELRCDNGRVIETLKSLNLQDKPLTDRHCDNCVSVDFSQYKGADGADQTLAKGDYVKMNWKAEHGFTVSAGGGYNPSLQARVLDTADQICVNTENGSLEFGSPNKGCQNGGLGQGDGGTPGEVGENCEPIGNVLVVQESNKACPDANPLGGTIKFVFDTPVLVSDIGLMDVDEKEQRIKITYDDGVSELFAYPGFGDNAVQRVICSKLNVKILEVFFPGTGAITEINFCPECRPLTRTHGGDSNCLTTENGEDMTGLEQIAFDDFEDVNKDVAVKGWHHAIWDTSNKPGFTQFLGTYKNAARSPYKEYKVPRDAQYVSFEIDLYEIDSWNDDTQQQTATDHVNIYVDGEKIGLGLFDASIDEGMASGTTQHGITWTRTSFGAPAHLGFGTRDMDQKHRVTIQVPQVTGMLKDGKLRLTLEAVIAGVGAVGWDNVRATILHICTTPMVAGILPSNAPSRVKD